ncbi:MAG: type II secretion system protein [Planctomycetaceae bacterium]
MSEPSKRPQSLSRQGFSLLEIVVTISILAVLIAIVIPAIQ